MPAKERMSPTAMTSRLSPDEVQLVIHFMISPKTKPSRRAAQLSRMGERNTHRSRTVSDTRV